MEYAIKALNEAQAAMVEAHAYAKKCNAVYLRDRMVRGSARDHTKMRRAWVAYYKAQTHAGWAKSNYEGCRCS